MIYAVLSNFDFVAKFTLSALLLQACFLSLSLKLSLGFVLLFLLRVNEDFKLPFPPRRLSWNLIRPGGLLVILLRRVLSRLTGLFIPLFGLSLGLWGALNM